MKTAVLCVHGIQGSPAQFDWIIRALPEDVHVEKLLLPGHGSDVRAFSKSTMKRWQSAVDESLELLQAQYDRIIYIGHSMGCLLGIDACIRRPEKLVLLVLLACPLRVRITRRYLRQNLIAVSPRESSDPFILAARAAHSVKAKHIWEYALCIGPYIALFKKIYAVNKQLKGLNLPTLAVFSELDEIVSRKSMQIIQELPCCESMLAPGCGHLYYSEEARRSIIEKMQNYT